MTTITVRVLGHRIHLVTVITLLLLFGILLWANVKQTESAPNFRGSKGELDKLSPITRLHFFRGWPFSPWMFSSFHGMKYHPEEAFVEFAWVLNGLVAVLLLFPVAAVCEWWCRNGVHRSTILVLVAAGAVLLAMNLRHQV
jgi:hypothetical protein